MANTELEYNQFGSEVERAYLRSAVGRAMVTKMVSAELGTKERQLEALLRTAKKYEEAVRIIDDVAKRLRVSLQDHYSPEYPAMQGAFIREALDALSSANSMPARRVLVIASSYDSDISITHVTEKTRDGWGDDFFDERGELGDEKSFLIGDPDSYGTNKFLLACKRHMGLEFEQVTSLSWEELEGVVQQLFDKLTDDPSVSLECYCEVLTAFIRNGAVWEWVVL